MNKMYTQREAEERVKEISNNEFELVGTYNGSREDCSFRHKSCGNTFHKRWANFVEAFREGSTEINCTKCGV